MPEDELHRAGSLRGRRAGEVISARTHRGRRGTACRAPTPGRPHRGWLRSPSRPMDRLRPETRPEGSGTLVPATGLSPETLRVGPEAGAGTAGRTHGCAPTAMSSVPIRLPSFYPLSADVPHQTPRFHAPGVFGFLGRRSPAIEIAPGGLRPTARLRGRTTPRPRRGTPGAQRPPAPASAGRHSACGGHRKSGDFQLRPTPTTICGCTPCGARF